MKLFEKIRAIFNFRGKRAEMELQAAEIRGDIVYLHPADDPGYTFCVSGKAIDILIDPSVALTGDDFMIIDNQKLNKLRATTDGSSGLPLESVVHPQQNTPGQQKQNPENVLGVTAEPSSINIPDKDSNHTADIEADTNPQDRSDPEKNNKSIKKTGSDTNSTSRQSREDDSTPADGPKSAPSYAQYMPKMRIVSMRLYQEEYDMLMECLDENNYKKTEYLLACVKAAKKKSMQEAYRKYYAEHQRRRKADREAAKRAAEEANKETDASA